MSNSSDLSHNIGEFIRDLRHNARISVRELAERAGVSNPYLSQIERGLRRPSAEVLSQIAGALRVSTALMYLRAGLLNDGSQAHSVVGAIAVDPDLTPAQRDSLTQIYEAFRRENARAAATDHGADGPGTAKPGATKPGDATVGSAKQGSAKPGTTKPGAAKNDATKNDAARNGVAKSGAAEPGADEHEE